MSSAAPSHKSHRYPVEVVSHCVWLYFRSSSASERWRS